MLLRMMDDGDGGGGGAERPSRAEERIKELVANQKELEARARAAEEAARRQAEEFQAWKAQAESRLLPVAPEPEDIWEDDSTKALREIAAIKAELEAEKAAKAEQQRLNADWQKMQSALAAHEGIKAKEATEDLIRRYKAARYDGVEFDVDAEAAAVAAVYAAQVAVDEATQARTNAEATESVITATGSTAPVTTPADVSDRPSIWDPAYEDYQRDQAMAILAQARG